MGAKTYSLFKLVSLIVRMHEHMIHVRSLCLFREDINITAMYFVDMGRRLPGCSRSQGAGDALIKGVINDEYT